MIETAERSFADRYEAWLLVAVAVGLCLFGILFSLHQRGHDLEAAYQRLAAVGAAKARQLEEWRGERLTGARALAHWPGFAESVREWLSDPQQPEARARVRRYLQVSQRDLGYANLLLTSRDGHLLLSATDELPPLDAEVLDAIRDAVSTRQAVMSNVHGGAGADFVDVATPVEMEEGSILAVLVERSDSRHSIDRMLETLPIGGVPIDARLITRDGSNVRILGPRGNVAGPQGWKTMAVAAGGAAPEVLATTGRRGRLDGVDADGRPVVADLRAVSSSPWLLVTAISRDMALLPAGTRDAYTVVFVALFFGVVATGLVATNRRRQRNAYRALYEAQVARQALERHYEFVVKYAPDVVVLTTSDGTIVTVNDRASDCYGYRVDELEGHSISRLRAPDEDAAAVERLATLDDTTPLVFQTTHRRRDSTTFPVEVTVRQITVGGRRFHHEVIHDITTRRQAEDARRASEEMYRRLFNNSNDAIFVHRFDASRRPTRFIEVNDVGCARLGYSREELLSMSPLDVDDPATIPQVASHIDELFATGRAHWEGAHITKDGRVVPVEIHNHLFEMDGEQTALATVRDISEQKRAEAALRASQEQLVHSQKMEAVGLLAGGIAHDFNNILSVIINYAEFAKTDLAPTDPLQENLREIGIASQRAANLTQQLLAFSRRQIFQVQSVEINDIVTHMVPMLRRTLGEDIQLETVLSRDIEPVRVDRGQFEQVIMNLAVNARDAMPTGGVLVIDTAVATLDESFIATHPGSSLGRHTVLAVNDSGRGMDAGTLQRIFEPFFTTKPRGRGTGLGLATVYGIVKQSGGSIHVESVVGAGTTFRIYLPVSSEPPEVAPDLVETPSAGGSERILLVEDEAAVRTLAARILTASGYTVATAENGRVALQIAREASVPFDVLVTDVVMPQMSGRQLADQLTASHSRLKVLYLSGYPADAIAHHGVLDPGVEFLGKPFTVNNLKAKVRAILDKNATDRC